MKRTHNNGQLRLSDARQQVTLIGWVAKRRNFGAIVFIDLRDKEGITQLVFNEEIAETIKEVRNEYILEVSGTVVERKDKNPKLATGDIEVLVESVRVVNSAETTPLIIADETDALEETRMKYRYLDLRRPVMQQKLMKRAQITKVMRNFLDDNGFMEIETPILTKSTPEGARDYLVPSRVHPGEFYALPQSPQIFKQLLMISGFERYYQVARCFRDEDLRADRQLDFTQVDIEMSFMSEEEIQTMMETMLARVMKEAMGVTISTPFLRLSYMDAMNRFGSDKPDVRYGMELQDLREVFKNSEFKVFADAIAANGAIKGIVVNNRASMTRKEVDKTTDFAKKYGAKGLVTIKYIDGALEGAVLKFFTEEEKAALVSTLGLVNNDIIFIVSDRWHVTCEVLGALRAHFAKEDNLYRADDYQYLWVVDFPLLEYGEEEQRYFAKHHPFTRPQERDLHLLESDPASVRACAYDLVLNGFELGGGSLRIYDSEMQAKMFSILGFSDEQIQERFGFFIDAFKYGTPPHGGIAFGLDRIAMLLTHSDSLRDVIAFPKNASSRCPMTNAPSPVDVAQLEELQIGLDLKK
ncbi:MAG: aspartate--tRNA ligase [Erysipelotrichaceae bacterium]